ncbi:UNVERIFIED_CONTAM: hypothetical protein GTU68_060941 [Idotea baltica]|nr:hypothetical protein [Idotea baltica]
MSQNVAPSTESSGRTNIINNPSKSTDGKTSTGKDGHSVSKRLQHELMTLMMGKDKGISAFPEGDNLFKWIATIVGANGTVYEDLKFKLSLEFPSNYPYSAPTVKFITPCFHPNVDMQGNICLDILKEKWSASYDIRAVLLSIQSLLGEPNNESPLNGLAAQTWSNKDLFKKHLMTHYDKSKST